MKVRTISTPVLWGFLIILWAAVIGCGKDNATSAISGTVSGDITANVVLSLTGDSTGSVSTDASGNFNFAGVDNGSYTLTPSLDGYSFSPSSANVTVSGASVSGVDFTSEFTGYSVSGNVTGAVTANVTIVGKGPLSGNVTTAADGSYTFPYLKVNGSYTATPLLAGYKFTPYSRSVTLNSASITGIDFVSARAHANGTASGTYTWDSVNSVLAITWANVDFPCNWPQTGVETESGVTVSNTTMTWPGTMIWTRESGSANVPAGTWTATDESANIYTAVITASNSTSGTISLAGIMVACARARSEHYAGDYKVRLSYQDPGKAATAVNAQGTGITDSQALIYSVSDKAWTSGAIDLGSSASTPFTYTFMVTDSGTSWVESATISCFANLVTDVAPSGTISDADPTFSWTGVSDAGAAYAVFLYDSSSNLIWTSDTTTGTSIVYNGGTALVSGDTYSYYVMVKGTSVCSSGSSYTAGSFTYSP